MDINNPQYCKGLTGEHKELPQEFSDAVQVKNSTAALVSITDDVQLMPYAYALVSPNNTRLAKLTDGKKIKIIAFTTNSSITLDAPEETAPKKKRQSKSSKSTSSQPLDAAVAELASIVSLSVEQEENEKIELEAEVQPTEKNLSEDDAKGTPEDNEQSV
jgi:hypothetical protein